MSIAYHFDKHQFNNDMSFNNVNTQLTNATIASSTISSATIASATITSATIAKVTSDVSFNNVNTQLTNVSIINDLNVQGTMSHVPTGTIIMYIASTAPIGFLLCNGSALSRTTYSRLFSLIGITYGSGDNSTTFNLPDLRGRSPLGFGQGSGLTNRNLNDKVGAETHTLTTSEMPSHNHTASSAAAGSHTHSVSSGAAGSHSHSGTTSWNNGHTHAPSNGGYFAGIVENFSYGNGGGVMDRPSITSTATGGAHDHTFSTSTIGDHYHSVTVDAVGSHSHTITVDNTGSGSAHNNMHPIIVINFIIKY